MKTVTVNTAKAYDVVIGSHILSSLGCRVAQICAGKNVAVISDTTVWSLYGEQVIQSLEAAGLSVCSFVFPAGEESKNGKTYLEILNFLAQHRLTRSDCIIALGGGVVGDIAGFAAATYLRGIPYIQVPTTLLAAVDSSVGGKTAIDLPAGKNLAGAFCQPKLVLCYTDTLSTLPEDIFRDGCAEVIKYAVLFDPELFSHLSNHGINFDREEVIARCVQWKAHVVEIDELDRGERMKLNLGHTIGHGIEVLSDFALSHGKAVAIGLAMICRAGCALGYCDRITRDSTLALLNQFQLPTTTSSPCADIYHAALSDKKRAGDTIHLIVPQQIGKCNIHPIDVPQLKFFIEAGM